MRFASFFIALLCCFWQTILYAQPATEMDSLLSQLKLAKEDSNKVLLLYQIGRAYENEQPARAKEYYRLGRDVSKKIGYDRGLLKFASNYTYVLNQEGRFDSSIAINTQAVDLAFKIRDPEYMGKALNNLGASYWYDSDYENAINYFERARKLFEENGDYLSEGQALDALQALHSDLRKYEQAVVYGKKAVELLNGSPDEHLSAIAAMNLGINYSKLGKSDTANMYFDKSIQLARKNKNLYVEANCLLNIAGQELQNLPMKSTHDKLERILAICAQIDLTPTKITALRAMGVYHLYNSAFEESKKYLDSSLQLAKANGAMEDYKQALQEMANLHLALHDYKSAISYSQRADSIGSAAMDETLQANIQELSKKYETEKKEAIIQKQKDTLEERRLMNYIFGGGAVLLAIIIALGYRTYHQKQKLQKQRISELETAQQLSAAQAVLKGEEQERARLAKDLHDGLSGMLSGIKYSLHDIKGNLILTEENRHAFERSMDMLDSSIQEMRRVAHNMMPEVLVRYGLDAALQDYISEINKAGFIKVVYQSMGMANVSLERSAALAIYRIIQELLNNVIKHAQATQALVQLFHENGKLVVDVEDNGKGFSEKLTEEKGGMGWRNIRSRVELLNGKIDIQSSAQTGTAVNLEFNIA